MVTVGGVQRGGSGHTGSYRLSDEGTKLKVKTGPKGCQQEVGAYCMPMLKFGCGNVKISEPSCWFRWFLARPHQSFPTHSSPREPGKRLSTPFQEFFDGATKFHYWAKFLAAHLGLLGSCIAKSTFCTVCPVPRILHPATLQLEWEKWIRIIFFKGFFQFGNISIPDQTHLLLDLVPDSLVSILCLVIAWCVSVLLKSFLQWLLQSLLNASWCDY